MTPRAMRLDFVSDVVCPWCAIGLAALTRALAATADIVAPEIVFHPLRLNPGLPPEGEPIVDNVARKYGITPAQARELGGGMRAAAAEVGVAMAGHPDRIYDTFAAHRLLHWAREQGRQLPLKQALLAAYFERALNISDPIVLEAAAAVAGLDRAEARAILAGDAYGEDVRADEGRWRGEGITAVPTIVIDAEFVIAGAQSIERLERALGKLAAR